MDTKVCIIGTGNLAWHLERWLAEAGVEASACSARTPEKWPEGDIYMLAVADGAIREIAERLQNKNAIIVHLSGTTSIDALDSCPRRGVIYPVQTFTKGIPLEYRDVPLLIEGITPEVTDILWKLAEKMSFTRSEADSGQRRRVHLAGVIASNFTNHLLLLAQKQLEESRLAPDLLKSLIKETVNKALTTGPLEAQTGPARRNDRVTVETQIEMLSGDTRTKEIYKLLSSSIIDIYNQ